MTTVTWLGTSNPLEWSNAADWSTGTVPGANDGVLIYGGTPPVLLDTTSGTTTVGSIALAYVGQSPNTELTIDDPGFIVTVNGNLIDSGTVVVTDSDLLAGGIAVVFEGGLATLSIDAARSGGSVVQVGTFGIDDGSDVQIGNSSITSPVTVTANQLSLNPGGSISSAARRMPRKQRSPLRPGTAKSTARWTLRAMPCSISPVAAVSRRWATIQT